MATAGTRTTVETDAADAEVDGQPRLGELPLFTRAIVHGSAAADLALRTAVASLVAAPITSWALTGGLKHDVERYGFYRDLAAEHDPERSFPRPSREVEMGTRRAPRFSFRAPGGRVELLRFESPFAPIHPQMREPYARFERNRTAWAQHWRHDDGPRPTLCVIHGFGASPYWLNSAFFSLPWLYGKGYDVLLYVLPFHGLRRRAREPFSGYGLFAHGVSHFNEAIAHAVHDFRVFVDHLEALGAPQIGVTGLSLGGYMASLLAAVEERLHLSIPNAAVTDIGPLARQWFPASLLIAGTRRLAGIPYDELERTLAFHSPLTYEPLVARDRRMIIGGLGDRLAPPEQSRLLWEHWGRCRLHWYPGNHTLHVNRRAYLREMLEFMRESGFA